MTHARKLLALAIAASVVLSCSGCACSSGAVVGDRSTESSASVSQLVVEIHFPLTPRPGLSANEYQYPWIMEVEDRVAGLTLTSDGAEDFDDGEEFGDTYAFFLTGQDKASVLSAAKKIASGPGVPAGAYIVVNTSEGDMGEGQRLELTEIPD